MSSVSPSVNSSPLSSNFPVNQARTFHTDASAKFKELNTDHFLSRKYIAHLFGDSFVEDSLHEGWYLGDALLHMVQVLKEYPTSPEIIKATANLEKCLSWHGRIVSALVSINSSSESTEEVEAIKGEIIDLIEELDVGDQFVIPAGCKGHSVLYEFKRATEEEYEFIIYNTGEGNHKHWVLIENEGTRKVQGAYKTQKIKLENLIESDFLDQLIYLRGKESDNFATELYDEILPLLEGVREDVPQDYRAYMRSQRSGTCAWKVLLAYLRYNLPIEQYKYIKLKMRLDVFDKWSGLDRELNFHKTTQKLLNRLVVNYERFIHYRDLVPEEYSKEELLCLALLKVQKTFNRYAFLLTDEDINKAEQWYERYTGQSIYDT